MLCSEIDLLDRLAGEARLRLFLDYDGTLDVFAPTPEDILPNPEVFERLARLRDNPRIRVALISGRRLAHIKALVPVPGILLAGTYGLEMRMADGEQHHRLDLREIRPALEEIKPRWAALIEDRGGFFLEDKDWSLALHARFADDVLAEEILAEAREVALPLIDPEVFHIKGGHKFLEVAPRLANKGHTVDFLLTTHPWPDALPLYIGDDDKDEEAFGVINAHGGLAVVVAEEPRESVARCRLATPRAVRGWLDSLLARMSA